MFKIWILINTFKRVHVVHWDLITATGHEDIYEHQEVLRFWTKRGLEAFLRSHPHIRVDKRNDRQRFITTTDTRIRD